MIKNKIKIIIPIITTITLIVFLINNYNLLERISLVKNKYKIINNQEVDLKGLKLYLTHNDLKNYNPKEIFADGKFNQKNIKLDWYGKEHLLLKYKNTSHSIMFDEFKFNSWRKIKFSLEIKEENNITFLSWELKSKGLNTKNGVIEIK